MDRYPVHTLAPDPHQGELDLRPASSSKLPAVDQKKMVLCQFCGSVHSSQKEVLRCKRGQ